MMHIEYSHEGDIGYWKGGHQLQPFACTVRSVENAYVIMTVGIPLEGSCMLRYRLVKYRRQRIDWQLLQD